MSDARTVAEEAFRRESGRALAGLIRVLGDFDLAEDAVQDAFVAALEHWPRDGVPDNPGAWITTTARRRAIDRLRRARVLSEKQAVLQAEADAEARLTTGRPTVDEIEAHGVIPDDRLRLIFTCCHPALSPEGRVALTLRTLGGLQTDEIARAFLVPEVTMAQRLVRAKRKIRDAGIPFRVPPDELLPERLDSVLSVLYLVYNEGYLASSPAAAIRHDLSAEGIRLARLLVDLMPDEPEAIGLLSLMLLHDARRAARIGPDGALVILDEQDRTIWDRALIDEGNGLLERAASMRRPGPYQLQAAIASVHDDAPTAGATDWPRIVALYDRLRALSPSPVVDLNRAAALAMAHGPDDGLAEIDRLAADGRLGGYHLLHAARADLLRRAGRRREAAEAYRRALAATVNPAEVAYLERRLGEVTADA
ncbi:MAG: RNA polymerase sigma factor [Candidatus Limnocylindrales bacterium]